MSISEWSEWGFRKFFLSLLVTLFPCILFAAVTEVTFSHSLGQANTSFDSRGMQRVHELVYVYYMTTGETRTLTMPNPAVTSRLRGYCRWYNYETDSMLLSTSGVSYSDKPSSFVATNYGDISYQTTNTGTTRSTIQPTGSITFKGTAIKVACDVSDYADFKISLSGSNKSVVEPTLSYRVIFDIRPASEIASKMSKSTPYEYYEFLAPAGSVILLSTAMNSYGSTSSYYYRNGTSQSQITTTYMFKDGSYTNYNNSSYIGSANRMYRVTAPADGKSCVYELRSSRYDSGYIIARWKVTGKNISEIGPSITEIVSNEEMDAKYNLAAVRNFDVDPQFLDTIQFGTDVYEDSTHLFVISHIPLPWDECSYGFVYPVGSGTAGNHKMFDDSNFAYWSEYAIVQGTPNASWLPYDVKDHNNPGTGCFMYVDANQSPGYVANLLIDGNLCPNSSVYISAWINNFAEQHTLPNLNFILYGVDESGNETRLNAYTTGVGNFTYLTAGKWYQVFVEAELGNESYAQYRVRIENNNNSAAGNDFGIDDIRIYTSKNPVQSLEGLTACGIKTQQELIDTENGIGEPVTLLRVNFKSNNFLADDAGNVNLYYRWVKGNNPQGGSNDTVLNLDYIGGNTAYGLYSLKKNIAWSDIVDSLQYNSVNDFIYRDKPIADGEVFFVQEEETSLSGSVNIPVLYIVHKSGEFKKFSTYSCVVSADNRFEVECGGKYSTKIENCKQLLIDDEPQERLNLRYKTLDGEKDYKLSVMVYYNDSKLHGKVASALPYCDWIVGVDDRFVEANLTRAFVNFRAEYPTEASSVNQTPTGKFTQANLDTLLKYEQYITLRKKDITTNIPGDGTMVQYVAYPIQGSCSDDTIPVCPNPMRIRLRSDVRYSFGKQDDAYMPEDIQGAPAIVRIAQSEVNKAANSFALTINGVKGNPSVGNEAFLYRTNDSIAQQFVGNAIYSFSGDIAKDNTITFTRNDVELNMLPGYDYKFSARYDTQPFDTAYGCFIVNVVPDIVIYNPAPENLTWHNDDNWYDKSGNAALIPVDGTKVILPVGNSALESFDSSDFSEVEGATYHLKYIYGFEPNTCGTIYFPVNATLTGQQFLNYKSACVDVPVTNSDYSLFGLPLKKVFSGDLFIPKAGDASGNDFEFNIAPCDNRVTNKILQKVYNSTTTFWSYVKGKQNDSVSTAVAGWGNPANTLNKEYSYTAVALQSENAAAQQFIQLPKSDDTYYFYAINKNTGLEYQVPERYGKADITRDDDCYKLLYNGTAENPEMVITYSNVEPDYWFLVTNPFMGSLSVSAFMDRNTAILDGFYYTYINGEMSAEAVTAESVIPAAGAFFIHTSDARNSIDITFHPDMVVNTAKASGAPAKANVSEENVHKLFIVAQNGTHRSIATVKEDAFGENGYYPDEDAELLTFNDNLTPFSVYTRVGNRPVMVNMVRTIEMVPLSVNFLNDTVSDVVVTFQGADNFIRPVYLYDAFTDEYVQIYNGMTIDFNGMGSDAVRYYLNIDRSDVVSSNDDLDDGSDIVISTDNNEIHLVSAEEIISVAVYDIAGHLIKECIDVNDTSLTIQLPVGVYVVEVRTKNYVSNNKVILK